MEEIWKDIVGYEGLYQVSNFGRVKSIKARGTLSSRPNNNGYHIISLWKLGKRQARTVHRLVAQAFIPNPDNKPQVNHIDGDKNNNCTNNLEWCTNSENQKHKIYVLGKRANNITKMRKAIRCIETGEVYPSVSDAARRLGLHTSNLIAVCKGYNGCHTVGGYHWEYIRLET